MNNLSTSNAQFDDTKTPTLFLKKDLPVHVGDRLKVRARFELINDQLNSQRIICQVLFFNSQGILIDQEYEGSRHSIQFGSYIELPLMNKGEGTRWSDNEIVAPETSRKATLNIYVLDPRNIMLIGQVQCVNANLLPLFESKYEIQPSHLYSLSCSFKNKIFNKNIAMICAAFFDENLQFIEGPYSGFGYSQRYGNFKYIRLSEGISEFATDLLSPEKTSFAELQIFPLNEKPRLTLAKAVDVSVDLNTTALVNRVDWEPIETGITICEIEFSTKVSKHEYLKLNFSYFSKALPSLLIAKLFIEFFDEKDMSGEIDSAGEQITRTYFFDLCGTRGEEKNSSFWFYCPANARGFKLGILNDCGSIAFINKDITHKLYIFSEEKSISQDELKFQFDLLSFWKGMLQVDIPREILNNRSDFLINFLDKKNKSIHSIKKKVAEISIDEGQLAFEESSLDIKSFDLCLDLRRFLIKVVVPRTAAILDFRITHIDKKEILRISVKANLFLSFYSTNLYLDTFPSADSLEKHSIDVVHQSINGLIQKYSNDVQAYEKALSICKELGDIIKAQELSSAVISKFKDPHLCLLARMILAEYRILSECWLPNIPEGFSLRRRRIQSENNRAAVAVLAGESKNLIRYTILRSVAQSIFGLRIFLVDGLNSNVPNRTGNPYEKRIIEGLNIYELNCISAKEIHDVPVDTRIEFATLLVASILQIEEVSLIHVRLSVNNLAETMMGLSLAKNFHLPIVLEIQEDLKSIPPYSNSFNLTDRKLWKLYKCLLAADSVLISSEQSKERLVDKGIDPQKIFVNPLITSSDDINLKDSQNSRLVDTYRKCYLYALKINSVLQ